MPKSTNPKKKAFDDDIGGQQAPCYKTGFLIIYEQNTFKRQNTSIQQNKPQNERYKYKVSV